MILMSCASAYSRSRFAGFPANSAGDPSTCACIGPHWRGRRQRVDSRSISSGPPQFNIASIGAFVSGNSRCDYPVHGAPNSRQKIITAFASPHQLRISLSVTISVDAGLRAMLRTFGTARRAASSHPQLHRRRPPHLKASNLHLSDHHLEAVFAPTS